MLDLFSAENEEFLSFLQENKRIVEERFDFPSTGEIKSLNAIGEQTKQAYILDLNFKSLIISRVTYQNRIPASTILLRLDIDNKRHRNPDGCIVSGNHIHIFDKNDHTGSWAFELSDERLKEIFKGFDFQLLEDSLESKEATFELFCRLNNCIKFPQIQTNLQFS